MITNIVQLTLESAKVGTNDVAKIRDEIKDELTGNLKADIKAEIKGDMDAVIKERVKGELQCKTAQKEVKEGQKKCVLCISFFYVDHHIEISLIIAEIKKSCTPCS